MTGFRYPIVNSGYIFWGSNSDKIYEMLRFLEPGLMVDVGAAMGVMTKKMLQASPESRVVAFEPYPPNCVLFKEKSKEDARIRLVEKAVSDKASGTVRFFVPQSVKGDEEGWEEYKGYSSVGYITSGLQGLKNRVSSKGMSIDVPVTTVSKEVNEHVLFMKVDVQGGESAVLRGCHSIIRDHGIDIMLIEFIGQKDVLSFLVERDYMLFDTRYLLIPQSGDPSKDEWLIDGTANLSTGTRASFGWPANRPIELMAYCEMMRNTRKNIGYVQTDIVAVHASYLGKFMKSASQVQ